jgi:hypothetical protein
VVVDAAVCITDGGRVLSDLAAGLHLPAQPLPATAVPTMSAMTGTGGDLPDRTRGTDRTPSTAAPGPVLGPGGAGVRPDDVVAPPPCTARGDTVRDCWCTTAIPARLGEPPATRRNRHARVALTSPAAPPIVGDLADVPEIPNPAKAT